MFKMLYRCPTTGQNIDFSCEPANEPETYETVTCRACNRVHLVNVTSGKVLLVPARRKQKPRDEK